MASYSWRCRRLAGARVCTNECAASKHLGADRTAGVRDPERERDKRRAAWRFQRYNYIWVEEHRCGVLVILPKKRKAKVPRSHAAARQRLVRVSSRWNAD